MRRPTIRAVLAATLPILLVIACGGNAEPGGAGEDTNGAVLDPDLGDDTEPDGVTEEDVTDEDLVTDDDGVTEEDADETTEAAGDEDETVGGGIEDAGALEPRVQEAVAQLVDDGADPDAIELLLAEPVVWSDGSIGCPEPGMMYTQALVEGYRILLAVDGEEVAFHGAGNDPPFRCDAPTEPASGGLPTS